ncbi:MAG: phosphatase PAP2 family protein [Bacteroidetes bacterium]|nr:phosphatase PAP2 family protein [Bacteroidota bacterium]
MTEKWRATKTPMIEHLLTYDRALFAWINSAGSSTWDPFWLIVTDKWSSLPLYLLLLLLLRRYYNWRQVLETLLVVALMILVTDQLANLFKYILVQRPRPCQEAALQDQLRMVAAYCGRYGYFSAHAASAAALASFFIRWIKHNITAAPESDSGQSAARFNKLVLRIIPALLLVWAFSLGYSRIYLGVHYPLDVLTGWFVGTALGGFVFYPVQQGIINRSVKFQKQ